MLQTPYQDHDLADLAALINSAYRGKGAERGWTSESYFLGGQRTDEASLRADLAAKPGATILTFRETEGDKAHACVWIEPLPDDVWMIGMLTVDPARQAGGTGRAVLDAAEAHARAQGGRKTKMTVIGIRDTLIAWYQRRGYVPTGATEPFPYGDNRFGEPTRDDLDFVVMEKAL